MKIPEEVLRAAWIAGTNKRREFPNFVRDASTRDPEQLWEEDPAGYGAGVQAAVEVVLKWMKSAKVKA